MNNSPPKTLIKIIIWILAGLVTLLILFYSVENWRGARAWTDTKNWLEAEGETLDHAALRPIPVAKEQNFCAIPLLASLTDFTQSSEGRIEYHDAETRNRFLELQLPDPAEGQEKPGEPNLGDPHGIDLNAWAVYLKKAQNIDIGDASARPENQIRNAFARFDPEFAEIAAATDDRDRAWFPVQYGKNFIELVAMQLPHLTDVLGFSRFLTVKGAAAIAEGDAATAKACIRIQLRLAEGVGAEPILICHLVEIAILDQAATILREGLLARTWRVEDLKWLSRQLESIDLLERGANALRGEMAGFFVAGTDFMKSTDVKTLRLLVDDVSDSTGHSLMTTGLPLIPDGWFDQNAALGCDLLYRYGILPMKNRDFAGLEDHSIDRRIHSTTPYNFFVKLAAPAYGSVNRRTVQSQVMLDAARLACALELFYLRNQAYPESLATLIPEVIDSIPNDPITGGPLSFIPKEDGYRIYSIGLNGKDEGGALFRKADGKVDRDKGDWVFSCERDAS